MTTFVKLRTRVHRKCVERTNKDKALPLQIRINHADYRELKADRATVQHLDAMHNVVVMGARVVPSYDVKLGEVEYIF